MHARFSFPPIHVRNQPHERRTRPDEQAVGVCRRGFDRGRGRSLDQFFFAPRFRVWDSYFLPEVDRARDTLRQLDSPFVALPNHNGRVNQWRLLFPVVGNTLRLSPSLFLGIPFLGCFATLFYVARLCQRERLIWFEAFFVTMLCAISPWYFVSTGWLAYFDSWLILCLLVASFSPHLASLIAVGVLAPWIDERFVLGLPLILVTRFAWAKHLEPEKPLRWTGAVTLCLSVSVYLLVRLIRFLGDSDPVTAVYTSQHSELIQSVSLATFAEGLWQGHRVMWLFVVALLVRGFHLWPRPFFAAATGVVLVSAVGSLVIAGDMHRSLEILFPATLAGMLLVGKWRPTLLPALLLVVLVASLLLPASHRLWFEKYPIHSLKHELLRPEPDAQQRVIGGVTRARQLIEEGDEQGAVRIANELCEEENHPIAYLYRAELLGGMGQFEEAYASVEQAERIALGMPDCAYTEGKLALQQEDFERAASAFKRALQLGGPSWSAYNECVGAIHYIEAR
ncbi:MAG: hypothetical protein AAFU85_00115 [Planctomycetota bacterium]